MLVRLFGSNFRSLRDDFELSMVAADLTRAEDCDRGVISVPIEGSDEPLKLLRSVGIFGHNASGKSTILLAAHALHWIVASSSALGRPGKTIAPYEPFKLDKATREAPVTLGCEVVFGRQLLKYEIEYRLKVIEREVLTLRNGMDDDVILIARNGSGKVEGDLITTSDSNQLYVKEMQPNVAVLSKLAQHGPSKGTDSARPYYKAILDATGRKDFSSSSDAADMDSSDNARFATDENYRNWIMRRLMKAADLGIDDVDAKVENVEYPESFRKSLLESSDFILPEKQLVVLFRHQGSDPQQIDFRAESAGTRKLFNIADDFWKLAHDDVALFADELSASLHPRLLDALVRAVNEPENASSKSQLIFSTHDTGLLEGRDGLPPALRRDQVYFTKKNVIGASELYSLAEFKEEARPNHNLRKRYLEGLYGAIPLMEKLSL